MSERDAGAPAGRGFDERLSPLIARGGVVATPALLVKYQGRLGLTSNELIYVLHILAHKWGDEWPYLAVASVAEAAGVHVVVARRWKASLIAKGLLTASSRVVPGIGRRADLHDLSVLFAQLEALALEEELAQARGDLPATKFHRGLSTIPQLSTDRSNRTLRSRLNENVRARGNESVSPPRSKSFGRGRSETFGETEAGKEKPDRETSQKGQKTEPHLTTNRVAAARPDSHSELDGVVVEEGKPERVAEDRSGPPGYFDAAIASLVQRHGAEFGDDDSDRTLNTVHHLWWNTRLPRRSVHRALKQAYYATRAKQRDGMIRSRPMAYYLGAVVNALAAACEETGLPPPPGWKSPADAPATGRGRARGAAG